VDINVSGVQPIRRYPRCCPFVVADQLAIREIARIQITGHGTTFQGSSLLAEARCAFE
jgi:hypothetical protein